MFAATPATLSDHNRWRIFASGDLWVKRGGSISWQTAAARRLSLANGK
jgi:hypothetical protein